jgi:hypothetical protein
MAKGKRRFGKGEKENPPIGCVVTQRGDSVEGRTWKKESFNVRERKITSMPGRKRESFNAKER